MDDADGPVAGGDTAVADEDRVALADGRPAGDDESVRYSLAWWLSFAVPISIALVAIMGAIVGYGVESHASTSSADGNDAQVASTYLSGHDYDALLTTQGAQADHDLWEQLSKASGKGSGVEKVKASQELCLPLSDADQSDAAGQAMIQCTLSEVLSGFAFPSYWVHGNPNTFNAQRFDADWTALSNLGRDVDVTTHTTAAGDQRNREKRLLWLGIILAVALAFCTLAQAATHHRWSRRPVRLSLLLAIPGWVLLVGCCGALVAWEL